MRQDKGFSLIEAVVSVSIFAVAATSIVGVYIAVIRLNQQSTSLQLLQQNARFIITDITRTVNNGQIDYPRYVGGVTQPFVTDLFLRDQNNVELRIFKQGDNLVLDKTGAGSAVLTSGEIKVLDFRVYVYPASNPFPGGTEHPTVTVFIDLQSNVNPREQTRLPVQLTAATRQYPE